MANPISIEDLLTQEGGSYILMDVRSPSEYDQGHIPGAISFPLFSDEERAEVGIAYKNAGQDHALNTGLKLVGPKLQSMVKRANAVCQGKKTIVHCWRGGKRSSSVGWLLDFAGHTISVLNGGYKAYRTFQRSWFAETEFKLIILGGKTGSGKTEILQTLSARGEQVLDLEQFARHKGSAFGWIGEKEQPTTEQFENALFEVLRRMDLRRRIWVENESRTIGRVFIPEPFWQKMKTAPLIDLEVPKQVRIQKLVDLYAGTSAHDDLVQSFERIRERIGGQHLKTAIEALKRGDFYSAAEVALVYYDKTYYYGLEQSKDRIIDRVDTKEMSYDQVIASLIECSCHVDADIVTNGI